MPARFGPTLALTLEFACAAFMALLGVVLLVNHPVAIPCLPLSQNQDAETLLYLATFVVVLPLALVMGPRIADRIASGPNRDGLEALTGMLASALAVAIIGVRTWDRLPWGDAPIGALGAGVIWWIGAVLVIRRAARPRAWEALARLSGAAASIWTLAGVLTFVVFLCFTSPRAISPLAFPIGVLLVAGGVVASERGHWPALRGRWGILADIGLVVLVLLAVPDLTVVRPELGSQTSIETAIIQFHQNFLLGPANDVLAGGAMLVDAASQYGVTLIYMLAGWFTIAPIGYGTLGFFSAAINALVFAGGYGILRIAGVSRLIAAATFAVAVVTVVFDTTYPINAIPQNSSLRFGLPMTVLVALVAAQRWPRSHAAVWTAVVTIAGLSSIWSLEAFVYTFATLAPLISLAAWLRPDGERLRWLAARGLHLAAACIGAHLAFASLTFAASGQLPDWGQYLAYLRAFLFEPLGDLNFDFAAWSPGLVVGALHVASAAGLVLLIARRPDFVRAERTSIVALTGVTAYGVAIYSYFNNRSTDFVLAGVALPAFLSAALWLSLLLRSDVVARQVKRASLAGALSAAALLVAVGWGSIGERYPHSALAHTLAGSASLRAALHRLWHLPPLSPAAAEGHRLLEEQMPGARRSLVLATPDLQIEILLRARRGNALPLPSPWQDSFIAYQRLPGLERAVDGLRGGERMLIDEPTLAAFAALRATPSIDPLATACRVGSLVESLTNLAPLQSWALKRIGERFDLITIGRGASGLAVVELVARR